MCFGATPIIKGVIFGFVVDTIDEWSVRNLAIKQFGDGAVVGDGDTGEMCKWLMQIFNFIAIVDDVKVVDTDVSTVANL